jgi:hypothetical protein
MSRGLKLAVIIVLPLTALAFMARILAPFLFTPPLEATILAFTPDPAKGQMGMIKRVEVRNVTQYPVSVQVRYLEGKARDGNGSLGHFNATPLKSPRPKDPFTEVVLLMAGESVTVGLIGSEDTALETYSSHLSYVWTPATKSWVVDWYTRLRSEWPAFLVRHTPAMTGENKATCPVKIPGQ